MRAIISIPKEPTLKGQGLEKVPQNPPSHFCYVLMIADFERTLILIDNGPRLIYKNRMKKYILAPLCSAFIVPGLGQIINQSLKKGLFILSVVFFLFLAGTIKLFFILQSAMADTNTNRLNTGPIGEVLQDKDLTLLWLFLGLFAVVWVYSILDAFWVGRKLERQ